VPVFEDDTADTLAARVLAVEHRIYPLALKLLAEDRVRIVDGRCIIERAARISREFIVPEPGK
jgi:phosphoribosylglycinamide formyltransferase-1